LLPGNGGLIGVAKPGSRFYKGVEYGLQIERRAANDLQHISGRGLLLQRLAQFVEQPRVLNSDHGLISERLEHRTLFIRKWARGPSCHS
jgi:hypothetical protein